MCIFQERLLQLSLDALEPIINCLGASVSLFRCGFIVTGDPCVSLSLALYSFRYRENPVFTNVKGNKISQCD